MRVLGYLMSLLLVVILSACGGKNYRAQLDFMRDQLASNAAAEAARADRLAERETACTGLAEAGAISACMLGITANTLADRSNAGGGHGQFVMPPPAPKTGGEIAAGLGLSFLQSAIPGIVAIKQSGDSRDIAIAQSGDMYGFLGAATTAWTDFGGTAIGGMERTSVASILGMRDVSRDWAAAAPRLRPSININGSGNNVGDGNTTTFDQSRTGRDRFAQSGDGAIEIDQSTVGRDRQQGQNNRMNADDTRVVCKPTSGPGASGSAGEGGDGGNSGGSGGAVAQIDCSVRKPG